MLKGQEEIDKLIKAKNTPTCLKELREQQKKLKELNRGDSGERGRSLRDSRIKKETDI